MNSQLLNDLIEQQFTSVRRTSGESSSMDFFASSGRGYVNHRSSEDVERFLQIMMRSEAEKEFIRPTPTMMLE